MEYRFKRDLRSSFMIIDGGFGDLGYEQDILRHNDINVLVPFHTLDVNNSTQVWYDITGLVSLRDYLMQQGITTELVRKVLVYLRIAMDEVERYLIDVNHLMLDVDTIYVVKNNNEWRLMFIYYPSEETESGLLSLLELCMSNAKSEDMELYIRLYDEAAGGANIDSLIKIIDDEGDEPSVEYMTDSPRAITSDITSDTAARGSEATDSYLEEDYPHSEQSLREMIEGGEDRPSILDRIKKLIHEYLESRKQEVVGGIKSAMPRRPDMSDKRDRRARESRKLFSKKEVEDDILEDFVVEPDRQIYEPTVLLKSYDEDKAYELKYMGSKNNSDIRIDKDEFLLGSSTDGNDCVIDSPVISRFHAKIIRDGSDIYLQDLNSTNGTSVNGKLLGYRDRVRLSINDEIMFADERYRLT